MGYMTNGLTFNTLRAANVRRLPLFRNARGDIAHAKADGSDWSLGEWVCAVAGELGELANIIKKVRRGDFGYFNSPKEWDTGLRLNIAKELADVVIYLDLLAHQCGVNLGEAVMLKWNEVSKRLGINLMIDAEDWHYYTW